MVYYMIQVVHIHMFHKSLGCDSTAYLYLSLNSCLGCTDPLACNYDSLATIDDGSCLTIYGCTDHCFNYDSLATCDDGSCIHL